MKIRILLILVVLSLATNSQGMGATWFFNKKAAIEKDMERMLAVRDSLAKVGEEKILLAEEKFKKKVGIVSGSLDSLKVENKKLYDELTLREKAMQKAKNLLKKANMHYRYILNILTKLRVSPMYNDYDLRKKFPGFSEWQIDSVKNERYKMAVHLSNVTPYVDSCWCSMLNEILYKEREFEEGNEFGDKDFVEEMFFAWKIEKIRNVLAKFKNGESYPMLTLPPVYDQGKHWRFGVIEYCGNVVWQFVCPEEKRSVIDSLNIIDSVNVVDYVNVRDSVRIIDPIIPPKKSGLKVKFEADAWAGSHNAIIRNYNPKLPWVGFYVGGQANLLFGRKNGHFSLGPKVMDTYWYGIARDYSEFEGDILSVGVQLDFEWLKTDTKGMRFYIAPMYGWQWSYEYQPYDSLVQDQRQRSDVPNVITSFNFWTKNLSFESSFHLCFDVYQRKAEGNWPTVDRSSQNLFWKFFFLRFGKNKNLHLGVQQKNLHFNDGKGWIFAVGPNVKIWDVFKIGITYDYSTETKYRREGHGFTSNVEFDINRFFEKIADRKKNKDKDGEKVVYKAPRPGSRSDSDSDSDSTTDFADAFDDGELSSPNSPPKEYQPPEKKKGKRLRYIINNAGELEEDWY